MQNVNPDADFKLLNIGIKDLKFRFKIVEMKDLRAIVTIDFGDFVVKGFRVSFSKYKNENGENDLWVTPPSYKDNHDVYHKMFFARKELWDSIIEEIKKLYNDEQEKHYKKRLDLDEDDIFNEKRIHSNNI